MSNLDELDSHQVCRTCLLTGDLTYLYNESKTEIPLADMLMMCTSVEYYETDGLPINMCSECIEELQRSYAFATKCRDSDRQLRVHIQKLVPEIYAEPYCSISYAGNLESVDPLGDTALAIQNKIEVGLLHVKDELDIKAEDVEDLGNDSRGCLNALTPMRDLDEVIKLESEEDEQTESNQQLEQDNQCNQSDFEASSMLDEPDTEIQPEKTLPSGRLYVCASCDKEFKRKDHYTNHMRTHTGVKPYICAVCDSSFARKDNLKYHMKQKHYLNKRVPVDDKTHSCTICSRAFERKAYLRYHMRTHTEKSYSCLVCNASFTRDSSLTAHMKTHSGDKPFACTVCDAAFDNKFNLTRHMRRHTEERPYSCQFCSASFKHRHSLTIHIRTHTGEKPYPCTLCSFSFRQQQHLADHMHRKHPD